MDAHHNIAKLFSANDYGLQIYSILTRIDKFISNL